MNGIHDGVTVPFVKWTSTNESTHQSVTPCTSADKAHLTFLHSTLYLFSCLLTPFTSFVLCPLLFLRERERRKEDGRENWGMLKGENKEIQWERVSYDSCRFDFGKTFLNLAWLVAMTAQLTDWFDSCWQCWYGYIVACQGCRECVIITDRQHGMLPCCLLLAVCYT